MTIEKCQHHCRKKKQRYCGVQYAQECFCGNEATYNKYGKAADSDCKKPCKGNHKQKCGGDWRQNVYDLGKLKSK